MNFPSFQKATRRASDDKEPTAEHVCLGENNYVKIKLQLLQDIQLAQGLRLFALSDLRQQLGYDSVPAGYEVMGRFDYRVLTISLEQLREAVGARSLP